MGQHAVVAEIDAQRAENEVADEDERDTPPDEDLGKHSGECKNVDDND